MAEGATTTVPVALDAMGGDLGPRPAVEGAVQAVRELGIPVVVVGDERLIKQTLEGLGVLHLSGITIAHAPEVVTMHDSPSQAVRGKSGSSLRIAFDLVQSGQASGVVSAGNTGAMMAMGLFRFGTITGIARPAIASLIPKPGDWQPTVLLDSGANVDCHASQLVQFALMGAQYARSVIACERPRVGILSNGSEPGKGNDITRSASITLAQLSSLSFVGYVEGRDFAKDVADVVVCDGFVGNIVLKAMEGTVELIFDSLRHLVERNLVGKFGIWLAKPVFKELFKNKLDPSSYGGAPLLGLNHIAVVCHGSSCAKAIMNGIRVTRKFVEDGLVSNMAAAIGELDLDSTGDYEQGIWDRVGRRFDRKKKIGAEKAHAKNAQNCDDGE